MTKSSDERLVELRAEAGSRATQYAHSLASGESRDDGGEDVLDMSMLWSGLAAALDEMARWRGMAENDAAVEAAARGRREADMAQYGHEISWDGMLERFREAYRRECRTVLAAAVETIKEQGA
jgi:hypothetical protein